MVPTDHTGDNPSKDARSITATIHVLWSRVYSNLRISNTPTEGVTIGFMNVGVMSLVTHDGSGMSLLRLDLVLSPIVFGKGHEFRLQVLHLFLGLCNQGLHTLT